MEVNSEQIVIAIQARMSSRRFPGKVLVPFLGANIIGHLVNNLKTLNLPVYVLTSKEDSDLPLVDYLIQSHIPYYRGSLNSLVDRYYSFMLETGFHYVIRVSGDSPLFHPSLVQFCLDAASKTEDFDLISNVFPRTFPSGQSIELFSQELMASILKSSAASEHLEHVTSYVYANANDFKIVNFQNPFIEPLPKMSLDLPSELSTLETIGSHLLKENLYKTTWLSTARSIHSLRISM